MSPQNKDILTKEKVLLSDPVQQLKIIVKPIADPPAIDLLQSTLYGTKGIRYQQTGQERKIGLLYNPLFFHLYVDGTLQGIYCLDQRTIQCPWEIEGFYGRYLAVAESSQGNGYGQLLKNVAVAFVKDSCKFPYLLYSYIEGKNTRSIALSKKLDFKSIAQLKTCVFRRMFPSKDRRFVQAYPLEEPKLMNEVESFYSHYGLQTFGKIGYQDNYFVLKEGEEYMAGVQANPVTWKFKQMPGFVGKLMMNLFPKVPGLRRLFQPTYSFLALEGIFYKKGREDLVPLLLESLLAHFKLYTALVQADEKNPIQELFKGKMGLLSGFQGGVTTHVMIKGNLLTEEQLQQLSQVPVYISSFDFT
ncbi:hypothetical protein [Siphonobacter sp. SORGH_AS_1065]|uniref:hypothetical protein n=1 Tax=Siphonobacter sp. SORGH_AS_1065 TaxID=3041795 RepID=UPI00277F0A28|nr:hypothetical protein [Siphonobacter sp. SORGH_AS_1065]MDQ1090444.1 GNAT superfamily N-acetyltransferase [Siphonobacter sp. SORGH_AS_1065]